MILGATTLAPPPPLLLSSSAALTITTRTASLPIYYTHKQPSHYGFSLSATGRRRREPLAVADEDEEDGEEEGEGVLMPMEEMGRWLRNKPAGFGVGKTYDTTMEEKLMEEIERAREAQLANIEKLKGGAKEKEEQQKVLHDVLTDTVVVPNGTRVRVGNLPRKKNIHRDLQLAFKEFRGVININPAVTGNRKTRDPICKGFAFVDLESEEAAIRFVQKYSKQTLPFGKVQKLITCTVTNPSGSSEHSEQSTDSTKTFVQQKYTDPEDEMAGNPQIDNPFRESITVDQNEEETILNLSSTDCLSLQFEETGTAIEHLEASHLNDAENCSTVNGDHLGSNDSLPSLQNQDKQMPSRKKKGKSKSVKSSNLSVPSSMIRLKAKERSVLSGVFSKYGGKFAPGLAKQS